MSALYNHPLKFTHQQIADAAERMAEEIFASIDHTAFDEAKAALDAEIAKAVDYATDRDVYHDVMGPTGSAPPVVAHQLRTHDDPERAMTLTVPRSTWFAYQHEKRQLQGKRDQVTKLRGLAAAYRNAQEFEDDVELDHEDIHELGLDREPAATS